MELDADEPELAAEAGPWLEPVVPEDDGPEDAVSEEVVPTVALDPDPDVGPSEFVVADDVVPPVVPPPSGKPEPG
jgi:hypothetical protein